MISIYRKDLKSQFTGMSGWLVSAFMLFMLGLYFIVYCVYGGYSTFGSVLSNSLFIFLALVPLLTMRSITEERRQKTDQLLLTSPISIGAIVWGKYLALVTVYALPLCVVAFYPLIMAQCGSVSYVQCYTCLFAYFLMGCAAIAIGLFLSSITENQIIAAVCSFGVLLLLYFMPSFTQMLPNNAIYTLAVLTILFLLLAALSYSLSRSLALAALLFLAAEAVLCGVFFFQQTLLEGTLTRLLNALSLFDRFSDFANGIFDLSALVYFITVTLLFVLFTCQAFEKRRYN